MRGTEYGVASQEACIDTRVGLRPDAVKDGHFVRAKRSIDNDASKGVKAKGSGKNQTTLAMGNLRTESGNVIAYRKGCQGLSRSVQYIIYQSRV